MTDIEKKALALLNEVQMEMHGNPGWYEGCNRTNATPVEAVCRAIEQHEAFKREVSDGVVKATHTMAAGKLVEASGILAAFIIPKTDPLVEVMNEMGFGMSKTASEEFRAALAARGLEIREKQP